MLLHPETPRGLHTTKGSHVYVLPNATTHYSCRFSDENCRGVLSMQSVLSMWIVPKWFCIHQCRN